MALKKVYIGGIGPFVYDDTEDVNDPDGDFAGQQHNAVVTDGDIASEGDGVIGDFNVTGAYKVDGTQVVGNQAAVEADITASYTLTDDSETVDRSELEGILDAFGAKINSLLAKLRTHGLIDT